MPSEDAGFDKLFDEVIASPELNLLSDEFEHIDNSQDLVYPISSNYPPILHRIQQHPPLPLSILKSHVLSSNPPTIGPSAVSGGGISPTLTWSGGPSPIEQDTSPGLRDGDYVDVGGESDAYSPLFMGGASNGGGAPNNATSTSRRRRSFRHQSPKTARTSRSRSSRDSSHSRSRSSRSNSTHEDDLAMSTLSLISSSSTQVEFGNADIERVGSKNAVNEALSILSSCPSSPTQDRRMDSPATHTRKKSRTLSRSSFDGSMTTTPSTPTADYTSLVQVALAQAMGADGTSNRLVPTGHRRNITSSSLVPLDAPTQIRNYLTPSSTSKKDTPSAFVARKNKLRAKETARVGGTTAGRKRSRDESEPANDDLEDSQLNDYNTQLTQSPPVSPIQPHQPTHHRNASVPEEENVDMDISSETSSLLSAIEAKRRQNTLAARRSRQRKLDYVRNLEELLGVMTRERDDWKERAERAEAELGMSPEDDD